MNNTPSHGIRMPRYTQLESYQPIDRDLACGPVELMLANRNALQIDRLSTNSALLTLFGRSVPSRDESEVAVAALRTGESIEIGRQAMGSSMLGEYVSRRHVRLSLDGGVVSIMDLRSENGTYIRDELERVSSRRISSCGGSVESILHLGRNDDAWFTDDETLSFGVFDGVGGSPGSDKASAIAARVARKGLNGSPRDRSSHSVREYLASTLHAANSAIRSEGDGAIATTATVAKILRDATGGSSIAIASVGDSRAYLLRDDELMMLTLDHGFGLGESNETRARLQMRLADATDISSLSTEEQIMFRNRNLVTSVLGNGSDFEISFCIQRLREGDKILLTTDGIHDNLTTSEIKNRISINTQSRHLVQRLIESAQDRARDRESVRAKNDDMTAVLIDIAELSE